MLSTCHFLRFTRAVKKILPIAVPLVPQRFDVDLPFATFLLEEAVFQNGNVYNSNNYIFLSKGGDYNGKEE